MATNTLDFIVIGAQKAGTTTLFEYLRRHPELRLPDSKEAPYFSDDIAYSRDWQDYLERAGFRDGSKKWGTVSTHYMAGGVYRRSPSGDKSSRYDERTVPTRIQSQVPAARLIAILRDPAARAVSHHRMMVMRGLENRSFDEVATELLTPESLVSARRHPRETNSYVTWGEYGRILRGYFDVFARDQILILFTDELERTPRELLDRIYGYLGVSTDFVPDVLGQRYREGSNARRLRWLHLPTLREATARSAGIRRLWHALPMRRRRWVERNFATIAYRVDLWNQSTADDTEEPYPTTMARLRDHYVSDSHILASMIGEVPPWAPLTERKRLRDA